MAKTKKLTVNIKNVSPLILSTGETDSTYIDSQMAFDQHGFPYISARRFKGLLRESAVEVIHMIEDSGITLDIPSLKEVFGDPWQKSSCKFYDLTIPDYDENLSHAQWLFDKSKGAINKNTIIDAVTGIRQQTAIENGVSKENSLRTIRVLHPGHTFTGTIEIQDGPSYQKIENLLVLSIKNLKYAGLNRTRGFGEIECSVEQPVEEKIIKALKGED
jgi:CRISPR-associated protein Csx10